MNFPWLTTTALLPLVGAIVVLVLPKRAENLAKVTALAFSVAALVVAAVMATGFEPGGGFQFAEQHAWIPAFGVHYALGVDGIGLLLVLLTVLLTPVVMLAGWGDADGKSVKGFFAWILVLETLSVGVFAATDVFLFYVLFEATLVPIYFLIVGYGGQQRSYAAVKFLIYSLVGGLLMLAAMIGLYVVSAGSGDGPSFLLQALRDLNIDPDTQKWLFLGFFAAFAIKAPMVPVHTWLPDAAKQSTPGTAVLLVSVLDKIGTFGMIRFCLQLFPDASRWATPVVVVLAVISIVYGAALAIGQGVIRGDLQRLIAYTSISHFGVMVLGIFAMTSLSATGATLYMVNHGLATALLFLLAGYLISRRGSQRIADYGGVDKPAPVLSGSFLFACLAGLSLPGLAPFVSEFLVFSGAFGRWEVAAVIGVCSVILAALYMLVMYQRTMTGPTPDAVAGMRDLSGREVVAVAPLIALILGLGLYPKPVIDVITPAVESTMSQVGVSDPEPTLDLEAGEAQQ